MHNNWFCHPLLCYLLNVIYKRVLVVLPVAFQSFFRWEFFTAKLHCDFKAVAAEVIEILHSCNARKEAVLHLAYSEVNNGGHMKCQDY